MSWCYYPNQHICQRGCRKLIPHSDELMLLPQSTYLPEGVPEINPSFRWVDVTTPINICCQRGVPEINPSFRWVDVTTPINILPEGVPARGGAEMVVYPLIQHRGGAVSWCWCFYPNQHICQRGCRFFYPLLRQVDVSTPINMFAREGAVFLSLVETSWCYYPNQHIRQRGCRIFIPY